MDCLGAGLCALPLNLLALIVSNVDNVPDLARLCRASRVLYYMAVPRLYQKIVLTSYAEVQYKNNVPEGYGGASPFTMGLNALITSNAASLVKSLTLQGEFPQHDLEDKARIGRVPDSSMLLNIAVRAVLGRCVNLEHFRWSMDFRLMGTAYAGLTQLKTLRKLHLKFSSSRVPQPTIVVPAMPDLISFAFTDYDPLGYPDDLSEVIFQATKLQDLTMHFSPRMRQVGESSLHLSRFFKKNIAAGRRMRLRRFALYNNFARLEPELMTLFDYIALEHVVNVNSQGAEGRSFANHFLDKTWESEPPKNLDHSNVHTFRGDMITAHMSEDLVRMRSLKYLYFIGTKRDFSSESPPQSVNTPPVAYNRFGSVANASAKSPPLGLVLLDVICDHLGPQLRHLIYPNRFTLSCTQLIRLLQSCPNLVQFSFAAEESSSQLLRHIALHAPQLQALRIKSPDLLGEEGVAADQRFASFEATCDQKEQLELELLAAHDMFSADCGALRYIGIGDRVWNVGSPYDELMTYTDEGGSLAAQTLHRRSIHELDLSDVCDVAIWRMDTHDWLELD